MANLKTISPFEVFEAVVESIKESIAVTNITQSNGLTTLFCVTENININNFVTIDCGVMSGEFPVRESYTDRIVVKYSEAYSLGAVKTFPYFDWGNLKDGKLEVFKRHEYPLIYMILPNPFEVNLDEKDLFYIKNYTFKFLVINRYNENLPPTEKTKTEYIYNNYVKALAELSDRFATAVRNYKLINRNSFNYKRSDEIPFGITISNNENGKSETLFEPKSVGCYLEIRVDIYKQYEC